MASWDNLLANSSLCYASYQVLSTGQGLLAEKLPGVCPLNTGKIWMHLISKCVNEQTKKQAMAACSNNQLCGGTKCGIKANLHTLCAIWSRCVG